MLLRAGWRRRAQRVCCGVMRYADKGSDESLQPSLSRLLALISTELIFTSYDGEQSRVIWCPVAAKEPLSGLFEAVAAGEARVNLTHSFVGRATLCWDPRIKKKDTSYEASWKQESPFFHRVVIVLRFYFVFCLHEELCLLCQGLVSLLKQANELHNWDF